MEIRDHVGKAVKDYKVTQGACTDGKYIYMVFERKKTSRVKIVKLKASNLSVVKVSKALNLGHGNDLCCRDGILYVTHSGTSKLIHRVDAKTLVKKTDVKVSEPGGYNGITVYKDGFILRKMEGRYFYITDKSFKVKKKVHQTKSFKESQGICYDPKTDRIYRGSSIEQSKSNYVSVYKTDGTYVKHIHLDKKCELEGVYVLDGKLYCTYYKKYKKKKKMHYEAYIKMLKTL